MPCTTILVGKKASASGNCLMARNDDSGAGKYSPKKLVVDLPQCLPKVYESVISHVRIPLPEGALSYTAFPNVLEGRGLWEECGVNSAGVGMTATETITSNPRVLGADPLVVYDPKTNTPGGIGEEDMVTITLPFIRTAREGVQRLGKLLEEYGTYELNGIGFSDNDEIWWMETIGGHHWMARRVPDDAYAVIPNQLGLDQLDFDDALGAQKNYMCSPDLKEFVVENHLDLSMNGGAFNPRDTFGSHSDSDHVYNTPRAWYMERYFNPTTVKWDGPDAKYTPTSDNIPWCMVPEKKITVEDIKYILSSHYQQTPYDPYAFKGDLSMRGVYRPIGINRTSVLGLVENRPDGQTIEWAAFASNPFNALVPFYTHVDTMPEYVSNTTAEVNTNNLYWTSRLIGAMCDASFQVSKSFVETYQNNVLIQAREVLNDYDPLIAEESDEDRKNELRVQANQKIADLTERLSQSTLLEVLNALSNQMKNAYSKNDA